MQRFVAAAATADDAHFARNRRIASNDVSRFLRHSHQVGMGGLESRYGFGNYVLRIIDEFLHDCPFYQELLAPNYA
ncbi:hypothetical protein GCM10027056_23350 [Glaciibacter psychrotolerans]